MHLNAVMRRIRRQFRDHFDIYAGKCLFIRQKSGKISPFKLNKAQIYIHAQLEKQLKETGQVRALIVKGRQQGCSTYVAGRFYWKVTHRRGVRVFILTHLEAASKNLLGIIRRFHEYCPAILRPQMTRANQKAIMFG